MVRIALIGLLLAVMGYCFGRADTEVVAYPEPQTDEHWHAWDIRLMEIDNKSGLGD